MPPTDSRTAEDVRCLVSARPPQEGWHWPEWGAELTGTAILLFTVVTAKDRAVAAGPPFSGLHARVALVAVTAGVVLMAVAISPLGRRSGAHLNPVVTLGLWLQGGASRSDLAGYSTAQLTGGVVGVAAARVWGDGVGREPVVWAAIRPGPQVGQMSAAALEAAATFVQLAVVFWLLRDASRARWAAPVAGALLAVAVIALATISGAGFSPVRGLAPDILLGTYPSLWVFVVGPALGAIGAALLCRWRSGPLVTGKLRHDAEVACHLRCDLPHAETSQLLPTKPAPRELS